MTTLLSTPPPLAACGLRLAPMGKASKVAVAVERPSARSLVERSSRRANSERFVSFGSGADEKRRPTRKRKASKWALSKNLQGHNGAAVVPMELLAEISPPESQEGEGGDSGVDLLDPPEPFAMPPHEIWEAMLGQLIGVYFALAVPFQTSFMGTKDLYRSDLHWWMAFDTVLGMFLVYETTAHMKNYGYLYYERAHVTDEGETQNKFRLRHFVLDVASAFPFEVFAAFGALHG